MLWSIIVTLVLSRAFRRIFFSEPWGALTGRWTILILILFSILKTRKKKEHTQFLDATSYNQQNQATKHTWEAYGPMSKRVHIRDKLQKSIILGTSQYHSIGEEQINENFIWINNTRKPYEFHYKQSEQRLNKSITEQ